MKKRAGYLCVVRSLLCLLLYSDLVFASTNWSFELNDVKIMNLVVKDCTRNESLVYTCLADRAARAVERAAEWDVHIFDGVTYKRNPKYKFESLARSIHPVDRFYTAIMNFLDSHTLAVDFAKVEESSSSRDLFGGGGKRKRIGKKEKRYFMYALMVLLGIMGLTAPLMLKTLALMAGKALISSKIALIMLGSIALKKIFQSDNDSSVKVHTHTVPVHYDEHDRVMDLSAYNLVKTL